MESLDARLETLVSDTGAWAAIILASDEDNDALWAVASFAIPADWMTTGNALNSGSMNARVFNTKQETVENDIEVYGPPNKPDATPHLITAAASVPIGYIGTLEVLSDVPGFTFGEAQVQTLRTFAMEFEAEFPVLNPRSQL